MDCGYYPTIPHGVCGLLILLTNILSAIFLNSDHAAGAVAQHVLVVTGPLADFGDFQRGLFRSVLIGHGLDKLADRKSSGVAGGP